MAEILVIRLGPGPDDPAHWIAVDSNGARHGPPVAGALAEAAADVRDRKVIVLVPGTAVLTAMVDAPVRAGARLQAALPYALEEFLADDVEDLHFASGKRRDDGRLPVAAVSRATLDEWQGRLHTAGIQPSTILADYHGIARVPGTINMVLDANAVLLNDGGDIELCLEDMTPGNALVAIGALGDEEPGHEAHNKDSDNEESGNPRHLVVWCEPADDERFRLDWDALRHDLDSVDVTLLRDGVLPRLAATAAVGNGINLLQGTYGPRKAYSGLFAPWKYAAILLLALVFVTTAAKAVNVYVLGRQEATLKERFQAEYREIVPGSQEVTDPVRLVASLRARAGGGGGPTQVMLDALEQLGKAVAANADVAVQAISFRADVVDLRLTAPSVSVLDNIRRSIDESGAMKARIQSTDQDGERVTGRLQIQVAGA